MAFDLYLAGGARKEIHEKLHERGCCKLYSQLRERSHIKHWMYFYKDSNWETVNGCGCNGRKRK